MQVLALDTATPDPSVTLLCDSTVYEESLPGDRRASEELLPAIERCLEKARLPLGAVDRIAVCSGPGSFTGLRIGLATAWALGRAHRIPVEPVPTLHALAEAAREGTSRVAAALDAGRGEIVVGVYALDGPRAQEVKPPLRIPPAEARARFAGLPFVSLPPRLADGEGEPPASRVSRALALAVARAPGSAETGDLRGIYSRPSAAQEKRGAP